MNMEPSNLLRITPSPASRNHHPQRHLPNDRGLPQELSKTFSDGDGLHIRNHDEIGKTFRYVGDVLEGYWGYEVIFGWFGGGTL